MFTILTGGSPITAAMGATVDRLGIYTITQLTKAGEGLTQKRVRAITQMGSAASSLAYASRVQTALLIAITLTGRKTLNTQIADSMQHLKDGMGNVRPLSTSGEGKKMIREADAIYPI